MHVRAEKMEYSSKAILDWLHRTLGVNGQPKPDEVLTECPKCGSNKLYFNIVKKVGVCHSASCEWHGHVKLKDLIAVVGFTPNQGGEWDPDPVVVEKKTVTLPGYPVLAWLNNQMMTSSEEALAYLRGRGLTDNLILNWGLTCDGERIYVPIYDGEGASKVLVNYNSRILPGYDLGNHGGKKYLYCSGAKTGDFILGWSEAQHWTELALVENTFVSLAYRYRMFCSTTFGSNVSDRQVDLIANAGIKTVAILWDENAWSGADRAIKKLIGNGVKAAYWKILGQPDDYPVEWVMKKWLQVKDAANEGIAYVDLRDECSIIRASSSTG